MMKRIETDRAPGPGGHYSQATLAGDFVYISGQLPVDAGGTVLGDADFDDQVRLAIGNMLAILQAAGGDVEHLAKVTAYIVGIDNWPRFNAIYAELVGPARPARAVVPVPELHHGCLVEVEAVAMVPGLSAYG